MAVEIEEEHAYRTFRKIVEMLCISGIRSSRDAEGIRAEPAGPPVDAPVLESVEETPIVQEKAEPEPVMEEPDDTEDEPEEAPVKAISTGYGGFLYVKCPVCGKIKGFCAKTRIGNFRCDCGSVTKLEHLVPLYMNCECGRNARYLTNMEEPVFDIVCYDCGNPVPTAWNPKKKQYETIRG